MSFRNSTEADRWLVITKFNEMKMKDEFVTASKIYNKLRFNKHKNITYKFVSRTLKRYNNTQKVSDSPRKVKKRKIDARVREGVVKHATNKKKPRYTRSVRKTAQILHGRGSNKRKISPTSVFNILKSAKKKYKR